MPIGSGIVYNTGDLILSQVSSSGTAFLETKIAAATSSLIYFDSTAIFQILDLLIKLLHRIHLFFQQVVLMTD